MGLTESDLGMHGNSPTIMAQGAAHYGKALRQLSSRIDDNSTCFDHENISATMALHLYEVSPNELFKVHRLKLVADDYVFQPEWLD